MKIIYKIIKYSEYEDVGKITEELNRLAVEGFEVITVVANESYTWWTLKKTSSS
jgi:hypothetical protein